MLIITPQTKVGELLDTYPNLEEVLIEISSVFAKLKNPILRKTIARVATLQQASVVGGVKVDELVNRLRKECGQSNYSTEGEHAYVTENDRPAWFNESNIKIRIDATPIINQGNSPMAEILAETNQLKSGEILELNTPFIPAPIIDMLKKKNFEVFTLQKGESFKTYLYKKSLLSD